MSTRHTPEHNISKADGLELYDDGFAPETGGVNMTLYIPDQPGSPERPVWAIEVHMRGPLENLQDGAVVYVGHGTPGYAGDPLPTRQEAEKLGILFVSSSRGSYSRTNVNPGRSLTNNAQEIIYLADALGINRIKGVFRSGGVPTGLELARKFSYRVEKILGLVGSPPPSLVEDALYDGRLKDPRTLGQTNKAAFQQIAEDPDSFLRRKMETAKALSKDEYSLLHDLEPDLRPADHIALDEQGLRGRVARGHAQALRPGARGWLDDNLANRVGSQEFQRARQIVQATRRLEISPSDPAYMNALSTYTYTEWGFHPSEVAAYMDNRIGMYWGDDDPFTDNHDTAVLAGAFRPSQIFIEAEASHFTAQVRMPDFMPWFFHPEKSQLSFAEYMGGLPLEVQS